MNMHSTRSALLTRLSGVCTLPAFEIDQTLGIGDSENASANRPGFGSDLTGFEAFVNHTHLADLWDGMDAPRVDELRAAAGLVISCWAISILPLLRGRSVFFFAGGASREDFAIRFHVDRGESDTWVDLRDSAFLDQRGLAVWRFDHTGLQSVHHWEPSSNDA
jgi:hypothetical protein